MVPIENFLFFVLLKHKKSFYNKIGKFLKCGIENQFETEKSSALIKVFIV